MHQHETQREPGEAQREIVTGSLGDPLAPPRCRAARRRRAAAPRTVSRHRRCSATTTACDIGSALRAMASARSRSSRHPGRPRATTGDAARRERQRQRRSEDEVAFGGSPSARSMTRLRPPQHVGHLASLKLGVDRDEGQPHRQRRIADRLDQRHGFGGQPRRLADPAMNHVLRHQPGHADGQRRLVPGGGAQLPKFLEAVTGRCRHGPGRRCRTTGCEARCASR